MAKAKPSFICLNCQQPQARWSGRCPNCGEWNVIVEQVADPGIPELGGAVAADLTPLKELPQQKAVRFTSGSTEFDRVMGGADPGVVPGSVMLLAGTPGVGKSTLLLSIAARVPGAFYFSAEESLEQIGLRATRLGLAKSTLEISAERRLPNILAALRQRSPQLAVIDSIQTVYDETLPGTPGSLVQVRENCWRLQQFAKSQGVALLLVGHVTKEGVIAGPKVMEHLVDVVMYLEGEKQTGLRLLRAEKNRFGSTEEVGIWQLTAGGFRSVEDPGKLFAGIVTPDVPGRALSVTLEGSRAFLIEVQSLVAKSSFGYPKRSTQGIDLSRLNLLLAVLENRIGVACSQYDVYLNIVGGFSVRDPGIDLAVVAAVASCISGKAIPEDLVLFGEVGLLGEIRPAEQAAKREKEVKRLGYRASKHLTNIRQLKDLLGKK
jgi:DNA repair protein RadA/Sms